VGFEGGFWRCRYKRNQSVPRCPLLREQGKGKKRKPVSVQKKPRFGNAGEVKETRTQYHRLQKKGKKGDLYEPTERENKKNKPGLLGPAGGGGGE